MAEIDMMDLDVDMDAPGGFAPVMQEAPVSGGHRYGLNFEIPPGEIVQEKVYITGLDELSTQKIVQYCEQYGVKPVRVQWINDTAANLVYDTPETAAEALTRLTNVPAGGNILDYDIVQLRQAFPYSSPDMTSPADLWIRISTSSDVKKPRARVESRYYLLHPESDPDEKRAKRPVDGGHKSRPRVELEIDTYRPTSRSGPERRPGRDRAERNDRSDRGDRAERSDRNDRGDRAERNDRNDRGDRNGRNDRRGGRNRSRSPAGRRQWNNNPDDLFAARPARQEKGDLFYGTAPRSRLDAMFDEQRQQVERRNEELFPDYKPDYPSPPVEISIKNAAKKAEQAQQDGQPGRKRVSDRAKQDLASRITLSQSGDDDRHSQTNGSSRHRRRRN